LFDERIMSILNDKQVQEIYQLVREGKVKLTMVIMDQLEKRSNLTHSERIDLHLLRSQLLLNMGNFSDTLTMIDSIIDKNKQSIDPLQIVDALLIKLEVKKSFGKVREANDLINQIKNKLQILKDIEQVELIKREARLLLGKAYVFSVRGDEKNALKSAKKSLELNKDLKDQLAISDSYLVLGKVFDNYGNMSEAFENYQQCLFIREKLRDKPGVAEALNLEGRMHIAIGKDYQKALECCKEALKIQYEVGNKIRINQTLDNLGWSHRLQGELHTALEYYQQLLAFSIEIDFKVDIFSTRFYIGLIYGLQGELDLALEYLTTALSEQQSHYEEEGIFEGYGTAWQYNRLGKLYREKEDFSEAKSCFQQCLTICEQTSNLPHKLVESEARFYLIAIALEENNPDHAHEHLKYLKDISDLELNKPLINQRFRIAQAILMKSSDRLKEKIGAQNILAGFLKEDCSDHDLVLRASIIQCELLLDELRLSGNQDVLNEVKGLMNHLLSIAKTQPSYWLLAEVYVFKSRLSLLDLDLKTAENLLDQALLLAEEKGLRKLAVKIFSEKTLFEKQLKQWDHLIAREAPLNDRLDLIQLESLLERIVYKKLESSEEETLNYAQRAKQIAKIWNSD
jgi:tetratricopeptide (TPR) repeat protein